MLSHCQSRFVPRRSQQAVLDLIFGQKRDEQKWYVVSPPGSGKTILGLYTAVRMNVPTLVLVPNTAIQEQWVAKSSLFLREQDAAAPIASVDPADACPITVLTYQALAQTRDVSEADRAAVMEEWTAELVEQGSDDAEAQDWLDAYAQENPERFQSSLLRRWKRRRMSAGEDQLLGLVNESAVACMEQLRDRGVALVIFDECHHLVGYWAQVGLALVSVLDDPKVFGLTATPPAAEDLSDQEILLHRELLHDVDFSLTTPAVVRDGHLAPYQDLVYFTRPTEHELTFVAKCSNRLGEVLGSVETHAGTTLSTWLGTELDAIPTSSLASALRRRATFLGEAVRYLVECNIDVPRRFAVLQTGQALALEEKADLVGRYASRCLLVSQRQIDREMFEELARAFRPLGYQLTERGLRRQQSMVSRVLALSEAKMAAAVEVLTAELQHSGDGIRALVICDFERSSAVIAKEISHLLTAESGGAIAAIRALTSNDVTDGLDPILVTGQTVIVDDDLLPRFRQEANAWFSQRGLRAAMEHQLDGGFYRIHGSGPDWNTRHYVAMVTDLFERGITRCLVGTRGLLGEGWDSLAANTLLDLTTAATRMTVNQLRGRAIRLDPANPGKVANIWDVVCLAPEFENGLSDYRRFARKHAKYYGLCDDGAIEFGLGHIHPALTEAGPEDVALNAHVFNAEMIERAGNRAGIYRDWAVGTPYENTTFPTLEIKAGGLFGNRAVSGTLERMTGFEITASEMLGNMCRAILEALSVAQLFNDRDATIRVTERSHEYFRVFLETSVAADSELFSRCLSELFKPIDAQRYLIPRYEQVVEDTWLSRLLPQVVSRYLRRKTNRIAIYHPVPEALGKTKDLAEAFSDAWNHYVSPGRAVFAKRGKGEEIVVAAKRKSQDVMAARSKLKAVWR